MSQSLRMVVADDEADMRDYFGRMLPALGHRLVAVANNGRELVQLCMERRPDLVITDVKMPDMDGIEAAMEINRMMAVPVVLVSADHNRELIARAESDHIVGYLVKPIKLANLEPVIVLAMRRFEQIQELSKEATNLRQAVTDLRNIEQAMASS